MSARAQVAGQRFGSLVAVSFSGTQEAKSVWLFRCDCGQEETRKVIDVKATIKRGGSPCCAACHGKKRAVNGKANATHGLSKTRIYGVHKGMMRRCYNSTCKDFPNYGGRGIKVCAEWHSLHAFIAWAASSGYVPGLTIERENVDGDYEPMNCTWVPNNRQSHNRRCTVTLTVRGEQKRVEQWSEITGIGYRTLINRMRLGWSPEDVISIKPVHGRNQYGVPA